MTDITRQELVNRFRKRVESNVEKVNQGRKNIEKNGYVLRNSPSMKSYFELPKIDTESLIEEFECELDSWIVENDVTIIPTGHITCGDIFDAYFEGKMPFGNKADKKHEFPDAFSIKGTIDYFTKLGEKTYVLSTDNDFLSFSDKWLIPTGMDNSAVLFDLIIRHSVTKKETAALKFIDSAFAANQNQIIESIKDSLEEMIDEEINNTPYIGYDVENGGADSVNVSEIEIINHSISNLDIENGFAGIECAVKFHFTADYYAEDYSEARYDREDDLVFNVINETRTISNTETIFIDIKVEFEEKEDFCEFEIESINGGNELDVFDIRSQYT